MISLFSLPVLHIKDSFTDLNYVIRYGSIFLISTVFLMFYYWHSYRDKTSNTFVSLIKFVARFFQFLMVSMGLALNNSVAVMEGYLGIKSPFVRTPKFNITESGGSWKDKKQYIKSTFNSLTFLELLMCFYALFGIYSAFVLKDFGLLPFHCMLALGFGYVAFFSYKHSTQ